MVLNMILDQFIAENWITQQKQKQNINGVLKCCPQTEVFFSYSLKIVHHPDPDRQVVQLQLAPSSLK